MTDGKETQQQPVEKKIVRHKTAKRILRAVAAVAVVLFVLPSLLYIPGVQRAVKNFVVEKVAESTGYTVEIGELSLKFPLRLSIDNLLVLDEHRDTMIQSRHVATNVRLLSLLTGDVGIGGVSVDQAYYRMLSKDSSMLLTARLRSFSLSRSRYGLLSDHIDLGEAMVDGADAVILFDNRKAKPEPKDTSAQIPLLITVDKLGIRNLHYRMEMMPTIERLDAAVAEGEILDVCVNMSTNLVRVASLGVARLNAEYIQPTEKSAKAFEAQLPPDTMKTDAAGKPWTVVARHFRMADSRALYATSGASGGIGFDPAYIQLDSINIAVDNLYNRGSMIRLPLTALTARERCGLKVASTSGIVAIDDKKMSVEQFRLATADSEFGIDAWLDASALSGDDNARVDAKITSKISLSDAGKIMPLLKPLWKSFGSRTVDLSVDAGGTMRAVDVRRVEVSVPKVLDIKLKGRFSNVMKPQYMRGAVDIDGRMTGGSYLKRALALPADVNVPAVALKGKIDYSDEKASGILRATSGGGKVVADGKINLKNEHYDAEVNLAGFNVRGVLPAGDIGSVSGSVSVEGSGYDIYKMRTDAFADIASIEYAGVEYRDLSASASLDNGSYDVALSFNDEKVMLGVNLQGQMTPDEYHVKFNGRIDNIDLVAMNMATERLSGGMNIQGVGLINPKKEEYAGYMRLSDLFVLLPGNTFRTDSIDIGFRSNPEHTGFRLRNNDMRMSFQTPVGLTALSDSLAQIMPAVDSMLVAQRLNLVQLNRCLPLFTLDFKSKDRNIVQKYFSGMGASYGELNIGVEKREELRLQASLRDFGVGDVRFDEITMESHTDCDSLIYSLGVNNKPDNAEFLKTATIKGSVSANCADIFITQVDRYDETGFKFGLRAEIADSIVTARLYPLNPRIAFRDWTVNESNYVAYDINKNLFKASMTVNSAGKSLIKLYTDRDGLFHNGINAELAGIELRDWLVLSPFAPPIDGTLSGNAKINFNEQYYWGDCCIRVDRMSYGKKLVGNLDLDAKLAMTDDVTKTYALADMELDGKEIMTLRGMKNDSLPTSEYNLDIAIKRLPLSRASAFLPDGTGDMSGYLNGSMKVVGPEANPSINGYLQFDTAQVRIQNYGSALTFDGRRIPVDNGRVRFDSYELRGANGNPITINGYVDLSMDVDKIYSEIKLKGRNVQVINGKKRGRVELYGKGFVDINGAVKGYANNLDMRASVSILAGTNLTYVCQTSSVALTEGVDEGVVKFVNFSDTTRHAADSLAAQPYAMRIKAALIVQPNAVFNVNLSPDGKDKVQIDGEGMLSYSQNDQGDASLIGRYAINSGFVRYSPPMMSEKNFKFQEGSSLTWNGNLLNPSLNIKAVQEMKVNVNGGNQGSRTVPFDVILNVGNTLSSLAVSFDLSTDGDMTIANELSGMTAEQRATQAMNLLLYNTYTGTGSSVGNPAGGLSGNMAFSFLESVVNKWAASNITGVDLSIGIDQQDRLTSTGTSKSMSYSYKVSKSVFDDRFKIVVGGNYTSDASAEDNLAQNLLNDLSFEYKLNKTGTTNVKLFYHKEYESILEGEITEYGAGFMWKRKISSFRDMFKFLKKWRRKPKENKE